MVLGIILGADIVAHTAGHRHGTQARGTNERIDFLLGKQVPDLHHADTAGNTERECTESAGHNAQCGDIDEGIHRHGGTHTQAQENGSRIHNAVAGCIEKAAGVVTDFLQQVTEHQHTHKGDCRRHKDGHNGGNGNGEDYLEHTHILYLRTVGEQLVLLFHVDGQLFLGAQNIRTQNSQNCSNKNTALSVLPKLKRYPTKPI